MPFRFASSVLALVALLASPVAAQVQDVEMPPSEVAARGHYLMGREHYQAARFAEAAAEFQQAYDLSHRPQLFYNVFLAQRDAGHAREAAVALRNYIEAVPTAPEIEILRGRLATLEAQVAEEDARAHTEQEATVTPPPSAPPPEPTPPAAQPTGGAGAGPWVVIGVGGAVAVGAIITGALTATTYADLSSSCPDGVCPAGYDVDGRRATGSTLALTSDILGGVAAATLVVGIVWEIVDATSPHADASSASIRCTPIGCRGTF